jgi:hypothetical protein
MSNRSLQLGLRLLFAVVITSALCGPAQAQERCFPETGFCISGPIRAYWERNGGLEVFGYPITPLQTETVEGAWSGPLQWFERDRLEDHSAEGQGVLAGRLGALRLEQQLRPWRPGGAQQSPGCALFAQTGYQVCEPFLSYWQRNGGLERFGYPIGEVIDETIGGGSYRVQYFERRRLELHPENAGTPYEVLLGLLGNELNSVVIDRTQDYKGVAFPDQRKVVRDSRGTLYIAYRKKLDEVYRIFAARSTNNGLAWSVLNNNQPIDQFSGREQRTPAIAVDAEGTLHLAWYGPVAQNGGANNRQIRYAQSRDGGASWEQRNLAEVPGYDGQERWQEHPSITAQGRTVTIVWEGFDQASPREEQIKLARSTDGGHTWSAWHNIQPEPDRSHSRPTLAVSGDGSRLYILAYGERDAAKQIIWSASTDGGANWSSWQTVAAGTADQRNVSLAITPDDRLHAVWQDTQSGRPQIMYAVYDGAAWSAPAALQPSNDAQFFPSIAVTGQGALQVVWTETAASAEPQAEPDLGRILGIARYAGQDWSRPIQVSPLGRQAVFASLRQGGGVDVIWMDTTDPENRYIRYGTFGS